MLCKLTYTLLCLHVLTSFTLSLSGYTPFWGETQDELFCRITAAIFEFPSPEWDEISQQGKLFPSCVLCIDRYIYGGNSKGLCNFFIDTKPI